MHFPSSSLYTRNRPNTQNCNFWVGFHRLGKTDTFRFFPQSTLTLNIKILKRKKEKAFLAAHLPSSTGQWQYVPLKALCRPTALGDFGSSLCSHPVGEAARLQVTPSSSSWSSGHCRDQQASSVPGLREAWSLEPGNKAGAQMPQLCTGRWELYTCELIYSRSEQSGEEKQAERCSEFNSEWHLFFLGHFQQHEECTTEELYRLWEGACL